jgi:lysozyme
MLVLMFLGLSVSTAAASGGNYHRVRYGETLYSIARHYGVSVDAIADANNIYNPNWIYAGQVLHIPYYKDYGYDGYKGNRHVVRYGETLTSIGYRYGLDPWTIAKANKIYNLNHIYAGQVLRIPSGYY